MSVKVSLAINSKDPVKEWLDKLIESALAFDEIIVYLDGDNTTKQTISRHVKILNDGISRDIKDGFNHVISHTSGDWVCSFCDDDFFDKKNLQLLIDAIKNDYGLYADVIHFPVYADGGEWGRYDNFTFQQILNENRLPHGSLIKRETFNRLGGYKTNEVSDWNLWIRAKREGCVFRYFNHPVYHFRTGHERSAYQKQNREHGANELRRIAVETL